MVIGSDNEDALLDLSGDSEDNNCSLSQEDVKDDLLSDADIFKKTCSEVSKSESGLDKKGSGNEDALIELSGNSDANNYSLSQDNVKEFLVNDKDIKNACSEVRKSESGVEVIDVSKNKLINDKFNEESLTSSNVTNLNIKCSETYLDKDNCQQSNESNASEEKCGPGSVCDSSDELNDTKPDAIEIHLSEKQWAVETNEACTKVNMIENNKNTDTTCEAQNIDSTENKFVLSEEDEDDDVIFEGESRLSTDNKALNCLKDVSKTNDSKEQKFSELQNVSGTENVPNGVLTHEEDLHNQRFSKEVVCKNGRMDADSNVIDGKEVKSINAPSDKEPEFAFDNELLHKSYSNIEEATSSIVDRKRPANFENSQEHSYKRSKLENAEALSDKANNLGNLSQNLGTHNEPVEVSDSDNEETGDELTTDTAQESDVEMATSKKLITMTEEELDKLVREKVKAYMLSEEKTLVGKLTAKVKELQQNNDQWKRKVKDLQVKVNDVTIVQQKMEKRKAATAALRQITTRNVAVQVEDGKTAYAKPLKPVTPATQRMPAPGSSPLTGQGTIRLPIPNSALAKPVGSLGPSPSAMINVSTNIDTPTVKTLLDTTRVQRTVGSAPLTTTTTSSQVINLVQYPSSMPVIRPAISQGLVSIPTQATLLAQPLSSPVGNPTSKVIDLTDDDDGSKLRLVASQGLITSPFVAQGIRQVLASPGTQIVSPVGQPMSGYQLLVASTTGMRQTMASHLTTTYVTTGGPPGLVSLQPMGQVTQGTLMARAATPATPNVAPLLRLASMPTHPAPFPPLPINQLTLGLKLLPPKPTLRISRGGQGIVLSWNMHLTSDLAVIASYQLFAYQETSAPPTPNLWKKVGEVKALALPMACTLTQFQVGNKYHFAVRALDVHQRVGNFSDPGSIHLTAVAPTSK
ncbi:activating transcription factor 7-interacting protein 1-like isoform X2 [Dreissena polymorpha]|nr:activating transcription factor 7-interacting protein 1-like isoform X2 [Dreissena polymorpha]